MLLLKKFISNNKFIDTTEFKSAVILTQPAIRYHIPVLTQVINTHRLYITNSFLLVVIGKIIQLQHIFLCNALQYILKMDSIITSFGYILIFYYFNMLFH